jgi:hypothetical protein
MKNVGMKVGMSKKKKKKKLDREQRKCLFCNLDKVEDELHFLFECSLYIKERCLFVNEIQILCSNFPYLNNSDKLYWLFNNEEPKLYLAISTFLQKSFETRKAVMPQVGPNWK